MPDLRPFTRLQRAPAAFRPLAALACASLMALAAGCDSRAPDAASGKPQDGQKGTVTVLTHDSFALCQ